MDARLIPVVLPVAKMVYKLEELKALLERCENSGETGVKVERYKTRLKENITKLEKELGYGEQQ